MIWRTIPLLALLVTAALTALPQIAVELHVVNSLTNAPVPGANVVFGNSEDEPVSGRTNAAGIFAGHLPSSGKYLVNVTHRGYAMKNGAMGEVLKLSDGESPLIAELSPLGIVTGRVLDQFGDPVRGVIVHIENQINVLGQKVNWNSVASASTNDLGEYRVAEIPPGEYRLLFEYQSGGPRTSIVPGSKAYWPSIGGLAFYPDADAVEQSQKIVVAAGTVTRLNDARISVRPEVTITGRITPTPTNGNKTIINVESTLKIAMHSFPAVQVDQINPKGFFRYEVLPGTYILSASDAQSGKVSQPITVTAANTPITGVELSLTSSYEITGRISVEGAEALDFSKLVLSLDGPPMRIESDGSFHTTTVSRHAYLSLQNLPEDWYIKSAVARGKPVHGNQFDLEAGLNNVLLSVSSGGAHVHVVVHPPDSTPEEAFVVLIPESLEPTFREMAPNNHGTSSEPIDFASLPPGTYRVFALDAASWAMMMRPDVLMSEYKNSAPVISVAEGESKTVAAPLLRIGVQ